MRSMADDPGLRQLLLGGMASEVMEVSSSRDESPRETDGDLSEGTQAMETAAEELEVAAERFPRREQHEIRGGDRRRGADSGRQAGRGSALVDQQYRPLRHGGDGGSSGRRYAPAGRSGNTASGTSGGEYAGDSARRSRTRGRRAHSVAISPRPTRPPAGIRVAQSGTATPRRAAGGSGSAAVEATRPATATRPTTGGPRRGQGPAIGAERGTGARTCGSGTPPAAARQRRAAPPGGSPPTPTSARSSGTQPTLATSVGRAVSRRLRRWPASSPASLLDGRGRPPSGAGTCSAGMTLRLPTGPAPRAPSGGSSRTRGSRVGISPTTHAPELRRLPLLPRGPGRAQGTPAAAGVRAARGCAHPALGVR